MDLNFFIITPILSRTMEDQAGFARMQFESGSDSDEQLPQGHPSASKGGLPKKRTVKDVVCTRFDVSITSQCSVVCALV